MNGKLAFTSGQEDSVTVDSCRQQGWVFVFTFYVAVPRKNKFASSGRGS